VLWGQVFFKLSWKYQLIISTHSIFPVLLKQESRYRKDNLIVLSEKYAEICVSELGKAVKFFNESNSAGE
jgi:hypothetical protein